ncbi:methyltransferase domain-containing protein [Streptomyces albofaciens]|uniref:methyltransferase domain-containing protein n=1 Tax=Streptomyces albofaciens TaxID=66866 RepID=UPI003CC793B2
MTVWGDTPGRGHGKPPWASTPEPSLHTPGDGEKQALKEVRCRARIRCGVGDFAWIGDLAGLRVAELGCGTGEHIAHAAAHGAALAIGIDVAAHRIAQARARYGHLPTLFWRIGDAVTVWPHCPG